MVNEATNISMDISNRVKKVPGKWNCKYGLMDVHLCTEYQRRIEKRLRYLCWSILCIKNIEIIHERLQNITIDKYGRRYNVVATYSPTEDSLNDTKEEYFTRLSQVLDGICNREEITFDCRWVKRMSGTEEWVKGKTIM